MTSTFISESAQSKLAQLMDSVKPGTEGIAVAMNKEKLKIPTLKIVQPTSLTKADCPAGARPGQIYSPNVLIGNSIDCVAVFAYQSRTKFLSGSSDGMIDCSSLDAVTGTRYGKCSECPSLPWRNDMRTDCMDNIVVYFLSTDLKNVFKVIFSKTSESAGKFLLRQASQRRNIWDTTFSISTESKSKNGKTWLQWKVGVATNPLTDPDAAQVSKAISTLCKDDWESLKNSISSNGQGLIGISEPSNVIDVSSNSDGSNDNLPF
jgi:hypothetical protein